MLFGAVQGVAELITCSGKINVDFADVRTVMSEKGMAMIGSGSGRGENRAEDAARSAICSPLLEDIDLTGAKGVLVNITSNTDLTIGEFQKFGDCVAEFTSDNATVVIGNVVDEDIQDEVRVTVVATGIGGSATENFTSPTLVSSLSENTETQGIYEEKIDSVLDSKKEKLGSANQDEESDTSYLDIPAFLRRQAD